MNSVCMATYNGGKFICAQLESILQQLGQDDEVIIVDDSSGDNTQDKIASLKDKRIKLMVHKNNLGVIRSFQEALLAARGDYIFLSDQDDIWLDNKVSFVLDYFNRNPAIDMICHDAIVVDANLEVMAPSLFGLYGTPGPGLIRNFMRSRYRGCCMAFRRRVLDKCLPLNESFPPYHDAWIGFICNYHGYKNKFIAKPLIKLRRHGDNASYFTRRPLTQVLSDRWRVLGKYLAYIIRHRRTV